jgi:hypothetical protein
MGGRPASLVSNANVPDAGTPINKSSAKTSWLFGINYADEAPPLAVFASSAVNPKFRGHYLCNMHQVEGIFGYPGTCSFSSSFAASENGSVTNEIFLTYLQETLIRLYPDVSDKPGKRVLLKVDSGPGWFFSDFRTVAQSSWYLFISGHAKWNQDWTGNGSTVWKLEDTDATQSECDFPKAVPAEWRKSTSQCMGYCFHSLWWYNAFWWWNYTWFTK